MIRSISLTAILIFLGSSLVAQVDSLDSGPKGGLSKLALIYYKIDFTPEQRQMLEDRDLELIFTVDKTGRAILEDVNGVDDPAIIDSLKRKTPMLPEFYTHTTDGVEEHSIFFMKIQFPRYKVIQHYTFTRYGEYKEPQLSDYEYIHKSGKRMDVLAGGIFNGFTGQANDHLRPGGGMKIDLVFSGKRFGGGLVMNFYGNSLKKNYSLNTTREQNDAPVTFLMGLSGSKSIFQKDKRELMLQVELCYASQNVTKRLDKYDDDYVQLQGFSPGIVAHYLIQIGKDRLSYYYGRPALFNHYINLHGAIRPVIFNLSQASGVMLEVGISYRMGLHFVDEYKLRSE